MIDPTNPSSSIVVVVAVAVAVAAAGSAATGGHDQSGAFFVGAFNVRGGPRKKLC
jgi:hypothetical protein